MSDEKAFINDIKMIINEQLLLKIRFLNGSEIVGTVKKVSDVGQNLYIYLHDVEEIQTGYCPISMIESYEYKQ